MLTFLISGFQQEIDLDPLVINLTQTLPLDGVLVEEVDGASITKHKTDMDHIIDHDLSTSSTNIGVNNL